MLPETPKLKQFVVFFFAIALFACQQTQQPLQTIEKQEISNATIGAEYFRIENFNDYKIITLADPWRNNEVYAQYLLYRNDLPDTLQSADVVRVKIPINRIIPMSASFVAMLEALSATTTIVGIDSRNYVYNQNLYNSIVSGQVQELGEESNLNYEAVFALQTDLVMLTGWQTNNETSSRLAKLGINTVYNLDWMEKTALGRAEWIRFIAAFLDKETMADSLFEASRNRYMQLLDKVKQAEHKVKLMHGMPYAGVWYVPGGNSYMAKLYTDAGADYFLQNDTTTGSIPMDMERVVQLSAGAGVWLSNSTVEVMQDAIANDERYRLFEPVATKTLFTADARSRAWGANDFWSSATANPDSVLADLIKILHPDLLPDYEPVFYRKVDILNKK